jgi:hypothetical protein
LRSVKVFKSWSFLILKLYFCIFCCIYSWFAFFLGLISRKNSSFCLLQAKLSRSCFSKNTKSSHSRKSGKKNFIEFKGLCAAYIQLCRAFECIVGGWCRRVMH